MERPSTPSRFNQVVVLIASIRRQLGLHPCTTLLLGLCFFLPALLLGISSLQTPSLNRRGTAELFEISQRARLVQSFVADPSAPVPRIWQQRLGPSAAPDRWARHGRGLWWLIWLEDGEPLLALPAVSHSSSLDLLFADELHRSSFDQLPPLKRREPSALEQSCLQRLTSGTAVQWQPSGLASISGSLFPALASVSHGCLRVALQGDRLLAEGPVAPSPFASLQPHHDAHPANFVRFDPPSAYLELNSVSLQPLLGSLFKNSLFAEQLDSRYGLPKEVRDVFLNAPVLVRLDALEAGRFQASIQARLMLAADQIDRIKRSIDAVASALLQRGFQRVQRSLLSPEGQPSDRVADVWLDPQGNPQGGWSLSPPLQGQVELLLTLGDAPRLGPNPLKRMGQQRLRLQARPDQLVRLDWLGPGWPRVLGQASQLELEMTALPTQQQPGWLRLQLEVR